MHYSKNKFRSKGLNENLLLELRIADNDRVPSSSKYFARPVAKGYVLFYGVNSDGEPQAIPGTIGEVFDSTYVKGIKNNLNQRDYRLTPKEKEIAEMLVSLGLYAKREEKESNADITFKYKRGRSGTPEAEWKTESDVPKEVVSYSINSPDYEFLLVDTEKKEVSLDSTWKENNPRRGGEKPGSQSRSSRTYVMPSGNVAFTRGSLKLKKLLGFLESVDSRVTPDFKIVSPDDKYKNKTLGQVASAPRSVDLALKPTGTLTAYHGTSIKSWESIQKIGLAPGKSSLVYNDLIKGYSEKNVYLTLDPHDAENYATRAAVWDDSNAIILKVEVPDLAKIIPDEDSFGWFQLDREYKLTESPRFKRSSDWSSTELRYVDTFSDAGPGKTVTIEKEQHVKSIMQIVRLANRSINNKYYAQDIDEDPNAGSEWIHDDEYFALIKDVNSKIMSYLNKSLSNLEAFAYRGRIPPKFIKKWKTYPRKAYPKSVEDGDTEAYEKTRADVLKKTKTFEEGFRSLRLLVREMIRKTTP